MYASILSGISAAALAVIAKLATQKILERVIETLVKKGAEHLAKKTGNTVDDEIARIVTEAIK